MDTSSLEDSSSVVLSPAALQAGLVSAIGVERKVHPVTAHPYPRHLDDLGCLHALCCVQKPGLELPMSLLKQPFDEQRYACFHLLSTVALHRWVRSAPSHCRHVAD